MKACYIHVPFCKDICAYCDFTRCRYHAGLADKWIQAVRKEINEKLEGVQLETLYIGGGTPSALSTQQLEELLQALAPYTKEIQEYTMEANVESLDDDKINLLGKYGINRISLGVQTLQDELLTIIHRSHKKADILNRIAKLHEAGLHNISVDLIYGLPTQTMEMWKSDLQEIAEFFPVQHISLYALTIEEYSEFGRSKVKNIDPSLEADMFEYAIQILEEHGFHHYEISNFAKPGCESRHNLMYWQYEDFAGIGCGASGKSGDFRYDNTRNLQIYLEQGPHEERIQLSKEDQMFEMVMMNLRTEQGVSLAHFQQVFTVDFKKYYEDAIRKQVEHGLLVVEEDRVYATYQGMLLLNDILIDFLPES